MMQHEIKVKNLRTRSRFEGILLGGGGGEARGWEGTTDR